LFSRFSVIRIDHFDGILFALPISSLRDFVLLLVIGYLALPNIVDVILESGADAIIIFDWTTLGAFEAIF
jgi:hypothetical protein